METSLRNLAWTPCFGPVVQYLHAQWSQLLRSPKSSSSRPHNSRAFVFPLKAPSVVCFSWKSRVSSLHCVPALEIIVIHLTSKSDTVTFTQARPPIFSYNQEMRGISFIFKPSQRASATGLPFTNFFLKLKRWNEASPLTAGAIRGQQLSDLYQTLTQHLGMTIFLFIQHLSVGARAGLSMGGGRLKPYTDVARCILQIWKE